MSTYHDADYYLAVDRAHSDVAGDAPEHVCGVCSLAAPFHGFDECLQCAVATLLVEEPDYLEGAYRRHGNDAWYRAVAAEWKRQSEAVERVPNLRVRQAS